MKFKFQFEVFGKTMKTEIEAQNESEAREILFKKIREQVKITTVESSKSKVDEMLKEAGIKPGIFDTIFGKIKVGD